MKQNITEVVAALIMTDDKFLVFQRPQHKARGLLWEFVGGKIEPNESPQAALIRECKEEIGTEITVGAPFMDVTHVYPDVTIHLTVFHAKITGDAPRLLEHIAMRAVSPAQMLQMQFCPADDVIIQRICAVYGSSAESPL